MVEKKAKTTKTTITKSKKMEGNLQRHETDTGSPEVQVGLLSDEINVLQGHVNTNKKDFDAKRSLLKKVARRRRLLRFLKDTNLERYQIVAKKLGLKI